MGRTNNKGKGVQNGDKGAPGEDKSTQASGTPEPTAPPPAEDVITIDLTKEYADPRNPERKVTGEDLLQRAERGTLFDKAQSKLHKQISDLEKKVQTLAPQAEKAKELTSKVEATVRKEQLIADLKAMGIGPASPPQGKEKAQADPVDVWLTGGEPPEKPAEAPVDVNKIISGIQSFQTKALSDIEDKALKLQKELIEDNREKEQGILARQDRINKFVERTRTVAAEELETRLPLVDKATIKEIIDNEQAASALEAASKASVDAGQDDAAEAAWLRSQELRRAASKLTADAREDQAKLQLAVQRAEEIEMLSTGGKFPKEIVWEKPTRNPEEAGKRREARLAEAEKRSKSRRRLTS